MGTVDLRDGIESLEYWRGRRRRLSWYRFGARREAKLMTRRWEQRVREAMVSQRGVSFAWRIAAGLLLVRVRVQRIPFRTALWTLAAVAIAVMSIPVLLFVLVLTQIF